MASLGTEIFIDEEASSILSLVWEINKYRWEWIKKAKRTVQTVKHVLTISNKSWTILSDCRWDRICEAQ